MHPERHAMTIPRDRGKFYWMQLEGAIASGADMIIPSDYFLYLPGMAGRMLRKEIPIQIAIPPPDPLPGMSKPKR